jgi:transposase
MLLKVLVYSYINNTYSSRKIEAALKENIHYMWLSLGNFCSGHTGLSQGDYNWQFFNLWKRNCSKTYSS